jgi:uncharacterized protein YxeA
MNANNTKIVITVLAATLVIVFLLLFKKQVTVDLDAPFVHLKLAGSNDNGSATGVKGEDLKAEKGNINAHNKTGTGVEVKRAEAGDSITLTNEAPPGGSGSPKP